jgi:aminoglycoside 6'-N-acetyltransferase I
MNVEALSGENLRELIPLILDLWPGCYYEEEYEKHNNMMHSPKHGIYLLRADNEAIGFISLSLRNDYVEGMNSAPVGYVEGIYIKPGHRGKGYGKMLMRQAEEWTLEKGSRQLGSDTELINSEGISFHQKLGFAEENRIVCFMKNLN